MVFFFSGGGVQSMSAALFPDCPGVKIVRFKISRQQLIKTLKVLHIVLSGAVHKLRRHRRGVQGLREPLLKVTLGEG